MTGYGRRRVQGKAEVAVGRLGPQHRGRRQLPVYGRVIILSVQYVQNSGSQKKYQVIGNSEPTGKASPLDPSPRPRSHLSNARADRLPGGVVHVEARQLLFRELFTGRWHT